MIRPVKQKLRQIVRNGENEFVLRLKIEKFGQNSKKYGEFGVQGATGAPHAGVLAMDFAP